MSTEYFVDRAGAYIGAFVDGAVPPDGAVHVPYAPDYASQIWLGNSWSAAPAPTPVPPTPREWLERLTQDKQMAISRAGRLDDATNLWLMKANGAGFIDVTSAETIAGVAAFVAAGVLDANDQALLLAP